MLITNNPVISEKVKLLRNHGTTGPYQHSFIGYNSRLDEIQAAILRIKLRHIDTYNRKRRDIASLYTSMLGNAVQCPVEKQDRTHIYHQYTFRTTGRADVEKSLHDSHISAVVYYPIPLHLQVAFNYLGYRAGDLPEAEAAAREVLSIPIYPELAPEDARMIAGVILKALKN
jgi:dTDP-4-amino-4,6-dideoxygalactose transaminase